MTDPTNSASADDAQAAAGAAPATPPAADYGQPVPPAQPTAPQYGAPAAPQYGAPGAPQYGAPAAPQYGAPQGGAVSPSELSDLTLNLWLSVFFGWLPALIFFLIRKDTASPIARKAYTDNLNWQIVGAIIYIASVPLSFILIGGLTALIPFVISLIHAITIPNQLRAGQPAKFLLAPNWVK